MAAGKAGENTLEEQAVRTRKESLGLCMHFKDLHVSKNISCTVCERIIFSMYCTLLAPATLSLTVIPTLRQAQGCVSKLLHELLAPTSHSQAIKVLSLSFQNSIIYIYLFRK